MTIKIIICIIAGIGAGIGTGFAGMSAAAVIAPMLVVFLGMDSYMAVGIALASDVLASLISSIEYKKKGNIDVKNGIVMLVTVLLFTVVGSFVAKKIPTPTMGKFSVFMTTLLGIKFLIKPVMTTKEAQEEKSKKRKIIETILCGMIIGFICGFIGAGGGMMMLILLTSVLGYDLKTAVGTSVFVMTFTALTGATSHFLLGGAPDILALCICVVATFISAQLASKLANKSTPKVLNRITGGVLTALGIVMIVLSFIK